MTQDKSIATVVSKGLCTGCGTCIALCPIEALVLALDERKGVYVPELVGASCSNCGLCLKVCPGHKLDLFSLNEEIHGHQPDNSIMGNFISIYAGYATDHGIRYTSSSGGLITALLVHALEEGFIDGALVTRMRNDRPLEPEPFIARTKEEIIAASKSKYCPVPANVAVKEILNSKEGEKFAVVGLPCHIQGIRLAEKTNKILKEKIPIHVGIVCAHTDTFLATEFILQWYGIKKDEVERIEYRGRGWPGSMLVRLKNGTEMEIPFDEYISVHALQLFMPHRCTACCEKANEFADISMGDAWRIGIDDEIGTSLCISRTLAGEKLLQSLSSNKIAVLERIEYQQVQGSQGVLSSSRFRYANAHMNLSKIFGTAIPTYRIDEQYQKIGRPKISDYLMALTLGINRNILAKRIFWTTDKLLVPWQKKVFVRIVKK